MNFDGIKKELKEKLGNHCCYFRDRVHCFTICDDIINDVVARIMQFNGDTNYFLVEFEFNQNGSNLKNTKKYRSVDDFVSDFIDNKSNERKRKNLQFYNV